MDRNHGNPEMGIPPDLTNEQVERCRSYIQEVLGPTFDVVAHLPRNAGIQGDQGIWGETILITASDQEALMALVRDPDRLEAVSTELTNTMKPLTRVVIDTVAHSSEEILIVPPSIDFTPNMKGD